MTKFRAEGGGEHFSTIKGRKGQKKNIQPSIAAIRRIKALQHGDFLSLIGRAKAKHMREKLLAIANADQIDAIIECVDNVNRNNVVVPKQKVQTLRRHSKLVQDLLKPRTSLQRRKRLLSQSGGFLGSLIPVVAATLGGVYNKLLE